MNVSMWIFCFISFFHNFFLCFIPYLSYYSPIYPYYVAPVHIEWCCCCRSRRWFLLLFMLLYTNTHKSGKINIMFVCIRATEYAVLPFSYELSLTYHILLAMLYSIGEQMCAWSTAKCMKQASIQCMKPFYVLHIVWLGFQTSPFAQAVSHTFANVFARIVRAVRGTWHAPVRLVIYSFYSPYIYVYIYNTLILFL